MLMTGWLGSIGGRTDECFAQTRARAFPESSRKLTARHQISFGETEMAFLPSKSFTKSDHATLPTLKEQYPPAIAANAFKTTIMSSTKPVNMVGTDVPYAR